MRSLIAATCIALTATSAHSLERDKIGHAAAGIVVAQWAEYEARRRGAERPKLWGCGAAAVVGLAKEAYDSTGRGTVDAKDFLATALAGCLSVTIRF